jgi:hypothetical protein
MSGFWKLQEYSPSTRAIWIIRAAQDRLLDTSDIDPRKIWNKLEKRPLLLDYQVFGV